MSSQDEKSGHQSGENLLMKSWKGVEDRDSLELDGQDPSERHHWDKKIEYFLSCMGYCVGLGNIWRFPYVCMRNGGGAFLIPFFVSLFVCALPLYFLESAMGQFNGRSCFHVWSMCPLFKGIGVSMNILSFYFVWYYSVILGWTLVYMCYSFTSPLPWTRCDHSWNSAACVTPEGTMRNASSFLSNATALLPSGLAENGSLSSNGTGLLGGVLANGTFAAALNKTVASVPSTEEFWIHKVLERSSGLDDMGGLAWKTTLGLIIANICITLAVIKGIRTTGKVVYITATLPYLLLTLLLILGMTLSGSGAGMLYYIRPDFGKLLNSQTWIDAFMQVFYSLGPGWGALITMSSYNKFKNNCMRDSIILTMCCEGTSIYGGFAIFSILGHMAYVQGVSIDSFANSGAGLAFVVYPTAISYLPIPQLWGFLFFLMLFSLGLDSQFAGVETFMTSIIDIGFKWMTRWRKSSTVMVMTVVTLSSLPFASRGGVYLFSLIDWYIAAFSMMSQAALECFVVAWVYGADRFSRDIELMLGRKPYPVFVWCWKFLSPSMLLVVLAVTLIMFEPANYDGVVFSPLAQGLGWFFSVIPFLFIIIFAVVELMKHEGSLVERIKAACTPESSWGPALQEARQKYTYELVDTTAESALSCCNNV